MKKLITIIAILITLISCTKQQTIVSKQSMTSILTQPQMLVGTWKFNQTFNNNVLVFPIPGKIYTSDTYIIFRANNTYQDSDSKSGLYGGVNSYSVANSVISPLGDTILQLDAYSLNWKNKSITNYLIKTK